ncbi:DUF2807 domain-containing protein [Protaetiibacter sp. SSC-01]|uniref:head GIN domain-containing protein n=1 Tax=Protaetiibacter sp. SSC-01 TaxID=2759943 RepID=UPI0016573398|nr:head GIN domain-containing protein [Protaetiibacter sp. SSC-01]QNO37760.1 DUF2807 domain-containing protein [Protaetiibacter sp. SSC-01]
MTTTHRRALAAVAALAVAGVALAGCATLPASGPRVTEEHAVSDEVHALRLEHAGDVVVELGDEPGLTVRAPQATMDRLTADEEGGTLVLGIRGSSMWAGRVTYTLTVRSFDGLEIEGSGDVKADFSSAEDVSIEVDGSGDVKADGIDARSVTVSIEGSGDVRLSGRADRGEYSIEGSGDIRGADLELREGEASISGAGDIRIHATDTVDARIDGSGDIVVTGPARVTRDVQGSGDVTEG